MNFVGPEMWLLMSTLMFIWLFVDIICALRILWARGIWNIPATLLLETGKKRKPIDVIKTFTGPVQLLQVNDHWTSLFFRHKHTLDSYVCIYIYFIFIGNVKLIEKRKDCIQQSNTLDSYIDKGFNLLDS